MYGTVDENILDCLSIINSKLLLLGMVSILKY